MRGILGNLFASPVAALCLVLSGLAGAQERTSIKAANTSSPRDTLRSFIDACNDIHAVIQSSSFLDRSLPQHARRVARVIDCIDSREMPPFNREESAGTAAVHIKEILDRVELPDWEEIPDSKAIEAAGGYESLSAWRIPGTRITITRVEEGARKHEYLFSPGTVERAPGYFESIRSAPYRTQGPPVSEGLYDWYVSVPGDRTMAAIVERLPEWLQRGRTLGLANWKWPGVLLTLAIAIILMAVAYRAQWTFTRRTREKSIFRYCLTIVFPVGALLVPLGAREFIEDYLTVRGQPLYVLAFLTNLMTVLAVIIVIFATANRTAASIIASPRIKTQGLNAQLIRIFAKLGSLLATLVVFIVGGQYLGIPIGTLLASAGIFGAAIALGSQDLLKSLFGTMALLADRPFRAGDRIKFDSYDGIVEDIGLRSTRLRLLSGHLVTLPNSELAENEVENITKRTYFRRAATIYIPLDTGAEQVKKAVAIIRENLANHEGMDPQRPPRVFFEEFDANAFRIRFVYWYSPPDRWKFKAFSEAVNFAIFDAFEQHGIQFSLPFRHSFWKHDTEQGPLDVQLLRDDGESPQPNA